MITFTKGDLFKGRHDALVNPVNTKGAMGKGLALQFKERYPEMYEDYKKACQNKDIAIGKPHVWEEDDLKIINFPTKKDWRDPSKLSYIEEGLIWLSQYLDENHKDHSFNIAIPALGAGLGGLDWEDVKSLIIKHLRNTVCVVEVYEPL